MAESFVIVGAGLSGGRAALSLRERGFGGRITLVGGEAHAPYDRPPLSKQALLDEHGLKLVAAVEAFADAGIELKLGTAASAIDRHGRSVVLEDGDRISYDRLLLATGARPRTLPGSAASANLLTLRTHDDSTAIRDRLWPGARMIVIGGGFIGLELAAAARRRGARVTVVEGLPRILARAVPAEIAAAVEERHRQEGVDFIFDAAVSSVIESSDGIELRLADGRAMSGHFAVVGIGAVPNMELARAAGLDVDNGIAVDATLATSDPGIFAAGDCCSFPSAVYGGVRTRLECWRSAQNQGVHVAGSMMGGSEAFVEVPWFWSDQYDMTLQIAGLPSAGSHAVRRDLGNGAFMLFHLDDEGRLVAVSGIGRGGSVGRDVRIAEMLIAARARPDAAALVSPEVRLKALLAA